MEVTNNKNHTRAKTLTLIPLIIFALAAVCLIPLIISYFSTGSDVTAVLIIIIGTICLVFTALPCLVMSVLGTVYASKAKKEGQTASRKFFVLGLIEIIVSALGVICTLFAVLLTVIAAYT